MDDTSDLKPLGEIALLRIGQIVGDKTTTPPIVPLVPVSRATLWVWIKKGLFPPPVNVGPRVTAWRVSDVRVWLEDRRQGVARPVYTGARRS